MRTRILTSVMTIAAVSVTASGIAAARITASNDPVYGTVAQSSTSVQSDGTSQQEGPDSEITVEGKREKLSRLRKEILEAEAAFYEKFDHVNTVQGYETHCTREPMPNSHILRQVCTPKFIHDISAAGMEYLGVRTYAPMGPGVAALKARGYLKYLHEMIQRDPTLHQAAHDYDALVKEYQSTRDEKINGK